MANPGDFAHYVRSVANLDALDKLAADLDKDVEESQMLINEIKNVFDSFPAKQAEPGNGNLRAEDLANFLDADVPQLLMDDMAPVDVDNLDNVIATMKSYVEKLKRNCPVVNAKVAPQGPQASEMGDLNLEQCANSLDQLGKTLANIKLNTEMLNKRNPELEDRLTRLCKFVNNFTQMVQAETQRTEYNKNLPEAEQDSYNLEYNEVVDELLSGINEVSYLLQKSND